MKNFKFKSLSSMQRYAATLLVLLTLFTPHAWAWYSHNNNSHIYFNDYNSQWVSDPSSNGIAFLMGRDQTYGSQGIGSQAYRMAHIEHTNLWYCYVAKWGNDGSDESQYQYVAFRFASGTTGWNDWQGGWDNRVTGRATYGSNTKYSQTRGDNITGRNQYYCPSSSSSNTDYSDINNGLRKYTAYLRVNFDEERDGTYDGVTSGDATWAHNLTFDFTGTYMHDEGSSRQSTISNLAKNCWEDGGTKWGYADIPVTGEVTFELKTLDTGFEIAGWAYSESATSPAYTDNLNNPTFQVLSTTSYVAFIRRKQYTVALNDNGGSGGSGSKTVKYDRSTNMTTSVSVPSKSGYSFQGYYTGQDGTGSMVINSSGVWQKNVTDYTGTDGSSNPKWVHDGDVTLYAKWTQTVTLHDNHGGSNNGSISAIYNGVMSSKVVPTYTDHTLDLGYYAQAGCTNKVMNLDGTLVANVTVSETKWTSSGSKWIHDGGSTLYAHWKVNAPRSITCTDNVVTISVPTDATVHYTTNGSTPTSSSPTYDPSNKPVIASSGITVNAIAVQSGCTNSNVTSQAVTYTPVYTVGFTTTNTSKVTGETSVLENKTYTATFSANTGYTLPTSVTVTIGGFTKTVTTDYTWSVSDGVGTLSIKANKITGNVAITVAGVAKTYTESGNLNEGDGGTAGTYTATYDATTIAIGTTPTRTGYVVEGYYKSYSDGTYTEKIADASGNLQSNTSYTTSTKWTNDGNVTLYTKWTPVTLTFKSDASTSAWGTATNWNPACVPTIEHDVVLNKSAVVSGGTTAAAKSVKIDGSSSTVKLTIESTGALIVAEDIKAKHEGEDSYGATNENDLRIESNASGNGTLIVGNASTNTMASYQAYSKSWYVSNYGFINQYIGIPFDELYAYQYYGRLLYEYDDARDAWKASSTTMEAFKAYNILSKTDSYDYFYLDGKLNLPGKDGAGRLQTLTCGSRIGDGTNAIGDYMFANSWTAPIYITAMTAEDFDGVAQAIYIFNAGSDKGSTDKPDGLGNNPGQWTTITLADIGSLEVIPSTQAFLVKNTKSGGTLKLDYNKHVFAPAKAAVDAGGVISTEPIRAPKHEQTNDNPSTRLNIIVRSDSIYSDYVRIHERADFTNDYDDGWEAAKIFGIAAAPQLYAISDIGRMAVNAVPEIEGMVIGFTKGSVDDTYTMSFEYDGEEALYLNDLKEQTSTLIAADNSYQFTSAANDTEARFVISCTPIAHTPTGVSDINNQQSAARKLMIDGKLYIIRDGGMYDTTGAMVK